MIMPLTSMMPMLLRAPAPGPFASTSGKWPMTVAAVVIKIGRRRVLAASMIAAGEARRAPDSGSALANLCHRIAEQTGSALDLCEFEDDDRATPAEQIPAAERGAHSRRDSAGSAAGQGS